MLINALWTVFLKKKKTDLSVFVEINICKIRGEAVDPDYFTRKTTAFLFQETVRKDYCLA